MAITSILTNFTLGSCNDFDVGVPLIGSKEMGWTTSFELKDCYLQFEAGCEYQIRVGAMNKRGDYDEMIVRVTKDNEQLVRFHLNSYLIYIFYSFEILGCRT